MFIETIEINDFGERRTNGFSQFSFKTAANHTAVRVSDFI